MKRILTALAWLLGANAPMYAQHPIIATKYTADPAPMVWNDTVYLYTTHDEDGADQFLMKDWLLYTSTDMVNWTDCGAVASLKSFEWAKKDNGAWAEQCVARNGKFYLYCPIHGNGIGVLVADSPRGPFRDPIGKPLVWQREHWNDIDPTVFIDDDGQAYMYWGNPDLYCVKLNADMVSYSGEIQKMSRPEHYQEGPWFYKRNGLYYLAFASTCCPEGIGYATSQTPLGPWKTQGYIMPPTDKSRGNHPGIIDYKGTSYVFGLNYDLLHYETMQHHERRSVSAERMTYQPDGNIVPIPYWSANGVKQVQQLNPYRRVEAETMAWAQWVKTRNEATRGMVVTNIQSGDYIRVNGVDFGTGAAKFSVNAAASEGGTLEIHLDKENGTLVGSCKIDKAGWHTYKTKVQAAGVHDVYFVCRGGAGNLFELDWWQFVPKK